MRDPYLLIRQALFGFPAEWAHELALRAMRAGWDKVLVGRAAESADSPILGRRLWGFDFPNPLGLAAGFDKDGRVFEKIGPRWGFGFVEVGTVTPLPQPGNPGLRVFRLDVDKAIINRMGFNSGGLDQVIDRLSQRSRRGIVGVNLGKNRESEDALADYQEGIRRVAGLADYLVINISSPNTPGLRDLQARTVLDSLLRHLLDTREKAGGRVPLLLKISPDLTREERRDIAEIALHTGIDGLIISNTTVDRPAGLRSPLATETGGLSGRPLFTSSTALLSEMYRLTQGRLPLVGVGGIASAEDAYAKIRAGASLVQIHTALIFQGPRLVRRISQGLSDLLRRDGFKSVADAVGADHCEAARLPISAECLAID